MATINNYQFGNSYCPHLRVDTSATILDENTTRVNYVLYAVGYGYAPTWSGINMLLKINNVPCENGLQTLGASTREIARGHVDVPRTTTRTSVVVSLYADYRNMYWNGTAGTEKTLTVDQDVFKSLVAPTIGTNTRNSDSQNTITWTNATTGGTPSSIVIQRSVNGGAWNNLATVSTSATSYVDTSTNVDNSYAYRVGAYDAGLPVCSASSNTTYNTPAAPNALSGARTSGTVIAFNADNTSNTATGLVLQYSSNGTSGWTDASQSYSGSPVTSFTYSVSAGGTYYYRAANTRVIDGQTVRSDYAYTDGSIATLSTANAPTLAEPASGAVLKKGTSYSFVWSHNPSDGTAQTKWEFGYTYNSTWTTQTGNNANNSVSITPSTNGTLKWRVRTAGANGTWSPYTTQTNTVATVPTVSISSLPATVETMPIPYTLTYTDTGYQLASATVSLLKDNAVVYSETINATSGSITADEFIPENNATYTMRVVARSTSTLQAETSANFRTDFLEPQIANLVREPNAETGYCNIRVQFVEDEERADAVSCNVYRCVGDEQTLIAKDVADGAEIVDKYSPLNTLFTYKAVTFTNTGIAAQTDYETTISTQRFFCYWGNEIAWATYDPVASVSIKRPSRQLVYYDGRDYPVLYDASAIEESYSCGFSLLKSDAQVAQFKKLLRDGGVCVYKSALGDVFHACISMQQSYANSPSDLYGTLTLNVTRINGGAL